MNNLAWSSAETERIFPGVLDDGTPIELGPGFSNPGTFPAAGGTNTDWSSKVLLLLLLFAGREPDLALVLSADTGGRPRFSGASSPDGMRPGLLFLDPRGGTRRLLSACWLETRKRRS
tara:strand:- start:1 stop:354 length:354 start_codon:yes stop_codon:yes gene_type:complete